MGHGRGRGRHEDSLLKTHHRSRNRIRGLAFLLVGSMVVVAACEDVTVQPLPVTSIEISPAVITILEREEQEVTAVLRGPGAEVLGGWPITWSTSDPAVADLPTHGRVRGVGPGDAELRAESQGFQATAPVTVLQGPTIAVATSDVRLEGRLGTDAELQATVDVTNAGNGTLAGLTTQVTDTGDSEANWLEAELSSSDAPAQLRLRASIDGLTPGTHWATVQIASAAAGNSPQVVRVTLEVLGPLPSIGLSPGSLAFGANAGSFEPASQAVQVTNVGGGTLDGLEAEVLLLGGTTANWLTANLEGPEAPTTLALEASARMLGAGTYRALVRVSSTVAAPPSSQVEITFNVSAAGVVRDLLIGSSPPAPATVMAVPERGRGDFRRRNVDPAEGKY